MDLAIGTVNYCTNQKSTTKFGLLFECQCLLHHMMYICTVQVQLYNQRTFDSRLGLARIKINTEGLSQD